MQTAPYSSAMRLGMGFNTYTHELCINDAVVFDSTTPGGDHYGANPESISQSVSYSTRLVDKISQVMSAMNISAAASLKAASGGGGLSGSYVDSDKFKESDVNFFCQVKVTNHIIMAKDLLKFNDMASWRSNNASEFTRIYGDSYISGFIEGGELNAVISIKSQDKSKIMDIKAQLEGSFGKGMSVSLQGAGGYSSENTDTSTETTISVNWTGGGEIKKKEELWTIGNLVKVAAAFPDYIRETPQRTHAIITKYDMLRSFHLVQPKIAAPLDYSIAELYTQDLLDAFVDYKNVWKVIHQMAEEVEFGTHKLQASNMNLEKLGITDGEEKPEDNSPEKGKSQLKGQPPRPTTRVPIGPVYQPTLVDLDKARTRCRREMGKILTEVSAVRVDPSIAMDADPSHVFLNPAIFRMLLPSTVSKDAAADGNKTEEKK